ncbi:catalase [Pelagicoccus sp. SDUM812002]|uniref:catalase n=1 Tax=Pelagicoccus sp. SDUM812002 TaxID=3041266 RepID=UPI00280CFF49|nr:catalase [Pelagicoccus sp. SDUM812002]MDQ8184098.1 catalase [Pelagicoccus sp. SDUM812002]
MNTNIEAPQSSFSCKVARGGELNQIAESRYDWQTTAQAHPISAERNSLQAEPRSPSLVEAFIIRAKISRFDHEHIPEHVEHARSSGARGSFKPSQSKGRKLVEIPIERQKPSI